MPFKVKDLAVSLENNLPCTCGVCTCTYPTDVVSGIGSACDPYGSADELGTLRRQLRGELEREAPA